jgi:hypothetical protein
VQSLSAPQLVRHAVGPQTYGAHAFVATLHLPPPSHVDTSVSEPPPHAGTPHAVVVGAGLHFAASTPLQSKPHVGSVAVVLHTPCPVRGAPVTGMHAPTLPGSSHAWQVPLHWELQQTPSAQNPEAQSAFLPHATPILSLQVPAVVVEALHDCPEPHVAVPQQTPSTHAIEHCVLFVHGMPSPCSGTHTFDLQK